MIIKLEDENKSCSFLDQVVLAYDDYELCLIGFGFTYTYESGVDNKMLTNENVNHTKL
jgi:hypothetical protein